MSVLSDLRAGKLGEGFKGNGEGAKTEKKAEKKTTKKVTKSKEK